MLQHEIGPASEDGLGHVQAPVDDVEKGHLVDVDLLGREARDLAPGAGRVVAILQVLGRQDQGGQEHAAAALQGPDRGRVVGLLHREVELGHAVLDADEVEERDLEGRVARARAAQRLLDKRLQRQDAAAADRGRVATADVGERPDGLDYLRCRVCSRERRSAVGNSGRYAREHEHAADSGGSVPGGGGGGEFRGDRAYRQGCQRS